MANGPPPAFSLIRVVEAVVIAAITSTVAVYAAQKVLEVELATVKTWQATAQHDMQRIKEGQQRMEVGLVEVRGMISESRIQIGHINERQKAAIAQFKEQLEDYREVDIRQWKFAQEVEERVDRLEQRIE